MQASLILKNHMVVVTAAGKPIERQTVVTCRTPRSRAK